jgi:hypothetical protein
VASQSTQLVASRQTAALSACGRVSVARFQRRDGRVRLRWPRATGEVRNSRTSRLLPTPCLTGGQHTASARGATHHPARRTRGHDPPAWVWPPGTRRRHHSAARPSRASLSRGDHFRFQPELRRRGFHYRGRQTIRRVGLAPAEQIEIPHGRRAFPPPLGRHADGYPLWPVAPMGSRRMRSGASPSTTRAPRVQIGLDDGDVAQDDRCLLGCAASTCPP